MKVTELRALAKKNNVTIPAGTNKSGIIDLLTSALHKEKPKEKPTDTQGTTDQIYHDTISGWCMTGHHEQCPRLWCPCTCDNHHTEAEDLNNLGLTILKK